MTEKNELKSHDLKSRYEADSGAGTAFVLFNNDTKKFELMVSYHGKNATYDSIMESAVVTEVEDEQEAENRAEDFVAKVDQMELV